MLGKQNQIIKDNKSFESDDKSWILVFLTAKNVKLLLLKGKLPKNAGQIIKELLSDNNIVTSKFKSCVTLKKDESEELLQKPRRRKRK